MICRFLDLKDAPQVEKLWDSCFEKRQEPFFRFYFEEYCFKKNRVFGGFTIEGELVTMMHLNPYRVRVNGGVMQVPYIVGVATAEKFRGHHYMGAMLEECCALLRQEGVPFVFLMPAAASIYSPYGFVGIDWHAQPPLAEVEKNFTLVPCDLEMENFRPRYDAYMAGRNGVVRSTGDWEKLLALASADNYSAYFLQQDRKILGYAVVDAKGEVLEIISPMALPRGKKPFIMARCLQRQDYRSFFGGDLYINEYF